MSIAGRKPVPTEVKIKRGETISEPPLLLGGRIRPPIPPDLSEDALEAWTFIVDMLERGEVLDQADAGVIEAAAVAWGRAREARRELNAAMSRQRRPSLLVHTPQGPVPNRLLDLEERAWKAFRGLAENLPLSPWGRARLGLKGGANPAGAEKDLHREIGDSPRMRVLRGGDA